MSNKRKKLIRNIFVLVVAIIIVFFAYLGSPLSRLKEIDVKGVNDLGEQQVIDATKIKDNSNILGIVFHEKSIKNETIKELPSIKELSFNFSHFNKLTINVKESETLGFIVKNGYYYRIITDGKIVDKKMKSPIGNYPLYSGFSKGELKDISNKYGKLPKSVKTNISEIHKSATKLNPYRIKIDMNDGNRVVADSRTFQKKMQYYPGIASQMKEKGTVDLQIGAYSYPFEEKK
ncbi:cell division protein FtsQ/DivIB [Lactobacillus terrae]|uniref:cell division protein FtsQ/DivIB n=1 Tax=Lactobacillus terrae TaxID=2269374 RepID=UPI000C1B772A|nr:cell division protein FtsQ/DivIB [Lactobacillus terrae]